MYDLDERLHNAAAQLNQDADPIQPRSLDELDRRVQRRDFFGDVGKAAAVLVLVAGPLVAWQTLRDRDEVTSVATAEPNAAVASSTVATSQAPNSSAPTALDPTQTSVVDSLPTTATDPQSPATAAGLTDELVEPLIIEVLQTHGVATDAGSYEAKDSNPFMAYFNVGSVQVEVSTGASASWSEGPLDGELIGLAGFGDTTADGWLFTETDGTGTERAAIVGPAAIVQISSNGGTVGTEAAQAIVEQLARRLNEATGKTFDPNIRQVKYEANPAFLFSASELDAADTIVSDAIKPLGFTIENRSDFEGDELLFNASSTDQELIVNLLKRPRPGSDGDGSASTEAVVDHQKPGFDGRRDEGFRDVTVWGTAAVHVSVHVSASDPSKLLSDDELAAIALAMMDRFDNL